MKKFLFLLAACALLIAGTSCERIDAGHEGILVDLFGSDKGVQDVHLVTGWVFYNPITQRVYEYPTYIKAMECDSFVINAQDGGEFTIDPKINIKIKDGEAPKVFRRYRKDFDDVISGPIWLHLMNACRIEINKFHTDSIVSNRENVEKAIEKRFRDAINKEGFELGQFTTGLKYPESVRKSVESKIVEVQNAQKAQNKILVAKAEAEQKIINARAEAEANKLRTQALTPQVLEKAWIDKWSGEVPTVMTGGNNSTFLDISKLK